ncbi:MAG TPA: hypothetical protein VGK70_07150, partial [Thermoanaerobaculia bacterium]
MDRARRWIILAVVVIAVAVFWFLYRRAAGTEVEKSQRTPPAVPSSASTVATPTQANRTPEESSKPKDPKASLEACGAILSRAILARGMRPGFMAMSLANLHRNNRAFQDMADAFCKQAGDDLVPICREILNGCTSDASSSLVAAILGHSRRVDAFDLLKELSAKGQGPPESRELFGSAVYSIGMIKSAESAPFLLKLYSEIPGARNSLATKFGTPLMAAIGMCGKEGVAILKESALAELTPDNQPEPGEGLRAFRWSHLGLVSSHDAFADLKVIAEGDSDIRLRG